MPGLVPETESENVATSGGNQTFSSTSVDNTGVQGSTESHLDSFFAESGWTREDVILVLMALQAALLLAWFVGVSDA